jgi:F-type H+-transporting ATPase subunit delta
MARPTTAARRYAEAIFEIAQRDGTLDEWLDELDLAVQLVGDEGVGRILDDPGRSPHDRDSLLDKLLGKRASTPLRNVVALLVRRSRIELLPAVSAEYRRLVNRERGVVEAVVTSAAALTRAESAAVRERVIGMTGADVDLREEVDESLIGGLTVRVGDSLTDASVRGRLERLRDQLVAGSR